MTLTDAEFISHVGLSCPACEKYELEATESVQVDDGIAWQGMECTACNATWQDLYNLVGYDNLDTR